MTLNDKKSDQPFEILLVEDSVSDMKLAALSDEWDMAFDLNVRSMYRTIRAWLREGPPPRLPPFTYAISAAWLGGTIAALFLAPDMAVRLIALWLVPLLTLTQLLQKLRSFAEHSGGPNRTPNWPHWTYSWQPGLAGRLTVWPYNINYHREHHDEPHLRWYELPGIAAANAPRLAGSGLWSLLHR